MTAVEQETVADRIEAEARQVMARRARLALSWETRAERADLLTEADALLEQFNLVTLGR